MSILPGGGLVITPPFYGSDCTRWDIYMYKIQLLYTIPSRILKLICKLRIAVTASDRLSL